MLLTIKKEWIARYTIIFFLFFTIFFLINTLLLPKEHYLYQIFSATYGFMALWGGVWGILIARKWGGFKSIFGRAIMFFAFGLFAQEFGQLVYSYYLYVWQGEIPYPSLGDVGYFGSIPLYILGVYYLGKASGVHIGLKSFSRKLQAIIIPLFLLAVSYLFFLRDYQFDWSKPLTIFLDFGYPMGQAIYISLALLAYLLSRNVLGGVMKSKILFILFALLVQYVSDYTFLYMTHQGTIYAGGINDYMYLLSYLLMALGLIQMNAVLNKIRGD